MSERLFDRENDFLSRTRARVLSCDLESAHDLVQTRSTGSAKVTAAGCADFSVHNQKRACDIRRAAVGDANRRLGRIQSAFDRERDRPGNRATVCIGDVETHGPTPYKNVYSITRRRPASAVLATTPALSVPSPVRACC